MYLNPKACRIMTDNGPLFPSRSFLKEHVVAFFQDVSEEVSKFGTIVDIMVIDNLSEDLCGNVYITMATWSDAGNAPIIAPSHPLQQCGHGAFSSPGHDIICAETLTPNRPPAQCTPLFFFLRLEFWLFFLPDNLRKHLMGRLYAGRFLRPDWAPSPISEGVCPPHSPVFARLTMRGSDADPEAA
eukprot:gene3124-3662_t